MTTKSLTPPAVKVPLFFAGEGSCTNLKKADTRQTKAVLDINLSDIKITDKPTAFDTGNADKFNVVVAPGKTINLTFPLTEPGPDNKLERLVVLRNDDKTTSRLASFIFDDKGVPKLRLDKQCDNPKARESRNFQIQKAQSQQNADPKKKIKIPEAYPEGERQYQTLSDNIMIGLSDAHYGDKIKTILTHDKLAQIHKKQANKTGPRVPNSVVQRAEKYKSYTDASSYQDMNRQCNELRGQYTPDAINIEVKRKKAKPKGPKSLNNHGAASLKAATDRTSSGSGRSPSTSGGTPQPKN